MRVAVTGAMGLIGSNVCFDLIAKGHEVVVVDFWDKVLRQYESIRHPALYEIYGILSGASDVLTPDQFIGCYARACDVIVHLGAVVDTMDMCSPEMVEKNVSFVKALVDEINMRGLPPDIIFSSSAAVYGSDFSRPNNPYGLTKSMGEQIVSRSAGKSVSLRFFNVFGAYEHHKGVMASIPFKLAQAYKTGDRIDLHSLNSSRDFISVQSVSKVVCSLVENIKERPFEPVYDVGTGMATKFSELDDMVMRCTGNTTSLVREIEVPSHIVGRYQDYTCAGMRRKPSALNDGQTTLQGIEREYGKR